MPGSNPLADDRFIEPWSDGTIYRRAWHVAASGGDDAGPGTAQRPLGSLAQAMARAEPGDEVILHQGIYREILAPQRGGTGPEAMIRIRSALDGAVVLSAADTWTGVADQLKQQLWRLHLAQWTNGRAHPFLSPLLGRPPWYGWGKRPAAEMLRLLGQRGWMWHGQRRLTQCADSFECRATADSFVVSGSGDTALVHLAEGDLSELSLAMRLHGVRPLRPGLGWIALEGLCVERCAGLIAPPLRGAIDTWNGHHWLIEQCAVRECVGTGITLGGDADGSLSLRAPSQAQVNGSVVRRCDISSCGVSGIAGTGNLDGVLIEHNHLTQIGWLDAEFAFESAAIKLHITRQVLIRANHIHDLHGASGVWLDYLCRDSAVIGNLIHRLSTLTAGIYIEANLDAGVVVSRNIVADVRDAPDNTPPKDGLSGGNGISIDISEAVQVERNIVLRCEHAGLCVVRAQGDRVIGERASRNDGHGVRNNLVLDCAHTLIADHHAGTQWVANHGDLNARYTTRGTTVTTLDREAWNALTAAGDAQCALRVETCAEGWRLIASKASSVWPDCLPAQARAELTDTATTIIPAGAPP